MGLGSHICREFEFEEQDRDVVYICELLVLDASIGRRLEPLLTRQSEKLLRQLLRILIGIAWVVEELGHLLVRHDVPDAVACHDHPAWHEPARFRIARLRVVGVRANFWFGDDACLLSEHVAQ